MIQQRLRLAVVLATYGMIPLSWAAPEIELKPLTPALVQQPARPTFDNTQSGKMWEMYQQMQQLEQQVRDLQGRIEAQESLLSRTRQDVKSQFVDLDQRIQATTPTTTTISPSVRASLAQQTVPLVPTQTVTPTVANNNYSNMLASPVVSQMPSANVVMPNTTDPSNTTIAPPPNTWQAPVVPTTVSAPAASTTQIPADLPTTKISPSTAEVESTTGLSENNPATASSTNDQDKQAYIKAYEAYRDGGAANAIPAMKNFVQNFQTSPYFPNANYWLGEFYLAISPANYYEAKRSFNVVINSFPNSQKASAALYRLATIADVEKRTTDATSMMKRIISDYPTSKEAEFAKSYITKLAKVTATPPVKTPARASDVFQKNPATITKPTSVNKPETTEAKRKPSPTDKAPEPKAKENKAKEKQKDKEEKKAKEKTEKTAKKDDKKEKTKK